jgi:hypothetical protein
VLWSCSNAKQGEIVYANFIFTSDIQPINTTSLVSSKFITQTAPLVFLSIRTKQPARERERERERGREGGREREREGERGREGERERGGGGSSLD